MKTLLPLLFASALTAPAFAQEVVINPVTAPRSVSVDVGLGAVYKPTYPGSDEHETAPWIIFRNLSFGGDSDGEAKSGFALTPSFNMVGKRDSNDDARLAGLPEVDRTYELGLKAAWRAGPATAYVTARKGVHGHHGITGEAGVQYHIDASDRLSLTAGLEAGYGDEEYNQTYFGVSEVASATSGYADYSLGGGINTASAKLAARYAITSQTALLGEVKMSKIVGDAADSPIVLDKSQPSVRIGIVHRLNFGF